MKLLIIQFPPVPCYLVPLRPNLYTLFMNTLSLYSSLNVKDQVSHPFKITCKIRVLYNLILIFLDSQLENK